MRARRSLLVLAALASPAAAIDEAAMVQPSAKLEALSRGGDKVAIFTQTRAELDACRKSQPERCDMLLFLAAYSALEAQRLDEGVVLIRAALDRALAGEAIEGLAELALSYAQALQAADRGEDSRPLLIGVLVLQSRGTIDADSDRLGTTMARQAGNLEQQGRFAEAEPLRRADLAMRRRQPDAARAARAQAAAMLALNLSEQGRGDEVDALFAAAIADADDAALPMILNAQGKTLDARGRYAEAEAAFRRALAMQEKALGLDDVALSSSLNNVGHVLVNQGRYREAEPFVRRALAIRVAKLGEDDPQTATAYNNLGTLLVQAGRPGDAEPFFRKALAARTAALGADHPLTGQTRSNLGVALLGQGKRAEACGLLASAVGQLAGKLGGAHPDVGVAASNAGNCYASAGLGAVALPLYRTAVAIARDTRGPAHPATLVAEGNLAGVLAATGQGGEAILLYRSAAGSADTTLGAAHPTSIVLRGDLGAAELAARDAGAALADLRRATAAALRRGAEAGRDEALAEEVAGYRRYFRRQVEAGWALAHRAG